MIDATTVGVYVHVPFCERVCPYCDFAVEAVGSSAVGRDREERYVELLLREHELVVASLPSRELRDRPVGTVYFGGGTPSLMRPESIERVLGAVDRRREADEVTLELNPARGDAERERLRAFRAAGVTRLSVGVQSFCDRVLKGLGRGHRGSDARAGLEAALAAGFDSVSADLIYGAPEQSTADVAADVDTLIGLAVPHVSTYALTLEPGTPFFRASREGKLALPDEDSGLQLGRRVQSALLAAGFERYEISSFARPGHRSRHNQRYWRGLDVLGLGVSAAGLLGGRRMRNPRTLADWERELSAGRLGHREVESVGSEEARREALFLGLRQLDGVSRSAYRRAFGAPPEAFFAAELRELRALDLIADEGGRLRLTERGILFSDDVFLRFVGR